MKPPFDVDDTQVVKLLEELTDARMNSGFAGTCQPRAGAPEADSGREQKTLVWDPTHSEAATLKRQALKATEGRRRQEATDRKVLKAIEVARREFEEGDHTAAFERLEPLRATHLSVAETLAELRAKAAEFARGLESAAAVQHRSEEWVVSQQAALRAAIADERWDDASAQLQELRARAPRAPDLPSLAAEVERGQQTARLHAEVERLACAAATCVRGLPAAMAVSMIVVVSPTSAPCGVSPRQSRRSPCRRHARRLCRPEAVDTWLSIRVTRRYRAVAVRRRPVHSRIFDPGVATATRSSRVFETLARDAGVPIASRRSKRDRAATERTP